VPGPPANAAVLPTTCAKPTFDLDGTVWSVVGSAESMASACAWPVGETRTLCDMEWTFVADAQTNGLYEVHYDDAGGYFIACAQENGRPSPGTGRWGARERNSPGDAAAASSRSARAPGAGTLPGRRP
jgi:hypothetical protein